MAAPTTITADNYSTLLKRSTQGRSGTPDGNIYYDPTSPRTIQLITAEEAPQIDLGGGLENNPLTNATKIDMLALYFFNLEQVEQDPALQGFRRNIDAVGNRMARYVGATAWLNGVKLSSSNGSLAEERNKVSNSGVTEFAAGGGGNTIIDRVYHGAKTSGLDSLSQPFYQIVDSLSEADRMTAAPVDFSKPGDINELIQTFGTTANGDSGAGDFDSRTKVLILGVRQFSFTVGEINSTEAGVAELGAYSNPYGLSHGAVLELSAIDPADVWGGSSVAPYSGLSFIRRDTPLSVPGFTQGSGSFTDEMPNTQNASLIQVRAWCDMLMQQDTDQNTNTASTGPFIPKRVEPLYTVSAQGKIAFRQGLYVAVPVADQQNVIYTDDSGNPRTWPFLSGVEVSLSSAWFDDSDQWFRVMYRDGSGGDDFDTQNAVTATDSDGNPLNGDNGDARIAPSGDGHKLSFGYAYDTNTEAGLPAGQDKDMVIQVGGINSKRATVEFTITASALIPVSAQTESETNR